MIIGIDFGKVISGGSGEDTDSFFGDEWIDTPELPHAMSSIAELNKEHSLYVISKCGTKIQERTLAWMVHHDFYTKTGILPENVFFVRKRPQKAPLAKSLMLDVFIDDRQDVLDYMSVEPNVIQHRILFTSWSKTMADISKVERFGKTF